jgi:hypothetical protein
MLTWDDISWRAWLLKERVRGFFLGPRPLSEPLPPDHPIHQMIDALAVDYRSGKPIGHPLVVESLEAAMKNVVFVGPPEKRFGETEQSHWNRSRWFRTNVWGHSGYAGVYAVDVLAVMPAPKYHWWTPWFLRKP